MRKILLPFSLIYGAITFLRNLLYSKEYLAVYQAPIKTIAIGNLNTGGTGKTPMTEFLLKYLHYNSAVVISRGYGRKTKGLLVVDQEGSAADYGDEALQIAQKFPEVKVIVAEKRKLALEAAKEYKPDLALLDDAYQHLSVKADTYILLTAYHDLFSNDFILPAGNLRESRNGAKRSQAIVVTKCPANISSQEKEKIKRSISAYSDSPIYFSSLKYKTLTNPFGAYLKNSKAILFSGIAYPKYMAEHLNTLVKLVDKHQFKDHHSFTNNDLSTLLAQAEKEESALVCSEKDFVKIASLGLEQEELKNIYILRVEHFFLNEDKEHFLGQLSSIISERK
jgi:tetraacyldisaccharide 4'-kinase